MRREPPAESRQLKLERLSADLVVVGGGMAGTCCAVTAARAGAKVVLIQDRPVLGGNASSEVRLWILGATAHMSNNNRWAREGGVLNEILVENLWRNREGNAVILDTILLEKVIDEPNLTLLLNTAVYQVDKSHPDRIDSVRAFCSQNSTEYEVAAPLFCDASGDGIVGFLAGAAFRMGAESADEFGEKFAPSAEYGELLGHSIYFYSQDVGRPVKFVPPSYALDDITRIPRYRNFNTSTDGCRLWWIEWGGRLDTVHDTETIKWELWKVVYGVWNHIKNSGEFADAENLTLEWVGTIPGKRESRRFEGDHMLTQQDIVEVRHHDDDVSFGGWSIDLHPADGVFSEKPGCNQWHSRAIFPIPYRCLYSRNLENLFLAGRIISCSHVAFGSTRVMATCANSAQAAGMAAAICARDRLRPRDLLAPERMRGLQRELIRAGQHIPAVRLDDPDDLARRADISAISRLRLGALPPDREPVPLEQSRAQMIPVAAGPVPKVTFLVDVAEPTRLTIELRAADRPECHSPTEILATRTLALEPGERQPVVFDFALSVDRPQYLFCVLKATRHVAAWYSDQRLTGLLCLLQRATQAPTLDIGVESFEFWTPWRRPNGRNFAFTVDPPLDLFGPENLTNGYARPVDGPNAWVADLHDERPTVTLTWPTPQTVGRVELSFDCDWDHPMESVLMGHPEDAMPFCVKHFRLMDGEGNVLHEQTDNHQTRVTARLDPPVSTRHLILELIESWGDVPRSLFEVRCYQA